MSTIAETISQFNFDFENTATVTVDMCDLLEILSLLENDPTTKKYADLKFKKFMKAYEFQQQQQN